ncbi:hypothetical protein V1224_05150 [Lachnospiraceae bacterium JLR.KK008]
MAKVICESCGSSFPLDRVKNLDNCPVCGKSLWESKEDNNETSAHDKELSFGDDVELGENDSFDEDKIDFWWYSIREPGTFDDSDTGNVYTTCTKCGHLVGCAPYPIARTKDYLLISSRYISKCSHCGNELKNHIISKRPESWVDPRKHNMRGKECENVPKCPVCSSTKIHKISLTNKAASALTFGVLSTGYVSKTYKCDTCGAKF